MAQISVTNLTFAYDGSYENIFENVSFSIDTDWKLGFIGRNGRGKTTFLNLLLGRYEYSGSISSPVTFDYFPFPVRDLGLNTADIVNEILGGGESWELLRELSLLRVPEDVLGRPFRTLSNGERTKVLLAALFLKPNSFLLIDEPTNHLDIEARGIVSDYIKGKSGYILVSHDRVFVDNCVDHILSINRQNIEIQRGNFSSWWQNKQLQDEFEKAENERLRVDIKRLRQAARQSNEWADKAESSKIGQGRAGVQKHGERAYVGEKSRRMQQRRKNLERRQNANIEEKAGLLKNIDEADSLKIFPLVHHASRLVELKDVSVLYDNRAVCGGVSFSVNHGERIVLRGGNGSGKSSILKLIVGEDITHTGEATVASRLIISYVPQDTAFLSGGLSDFAKQHALDESLFLAILRKLDFSRAQFEKNMEDYSGGQKKKVLIAKSLCERAHLYIWDEPLNFIDVLSRIQIEQLILQFCPTLLFVEHDSAFCESVATGVVRI